MCAERMAEALQENRSRDLWSEIKRLRSEPGMGPTRVDDAEGPEVSRLFMEKCKALYSSVAFDETEMECFLDELSADVQVKCREGGCRDHFSLTVMDVRYSIGRLNAGKSDANEELSSDNFIFACDDLFVTCPCCLR